MPDDTITDLNTALRRLGAVEARLERAERVLKRIALEAIDLPHAKALANAEIVANARIQLPGASRPSAPQRP